MVKYILIAVIALQFGCFKSQDSHNQSAEEKTKGISPIEEPVGTTKEGTNTGQLQVPHQPPSEHMGGKIQDVRPKDKALTAECEEKEKAGALKEGTQDYLACLRLKE